jgi:hypothetical protein
MNKKDILFFNKKLKYIFHKSTPTTQFVQTYIYTPSVFRIYADIQGWITNENMRNKLNS